MSKTDFKAAELGKELKDIISQTLSMLDQFNYSDIEEKLIRELDELDERNEIKIAFVGQYDSGKSTIISALTGNKDIKISADVETDVVSEYNWNDIILLDTPGILAGKLEQHDTRTKEAIKKCDLIVYVLTSQLFDDVIFENFIDLAYNQHLNDKMMVVINKMSMESGDYKTLSENYRASINSIFKERGYDFNFPLVCIDAKDYIDGVNENDDEFIQLSRFNDFVDQLNAFVENRGLIKKQFDTPIRILKGCISDVAISDVDSGLLDIYTNYIARIRKCMRDIKMDTELIADRFENSAIAKSNEVAAQIGSINSDDLKAKNEALTREINEMVVDYTKKVEDKANSNYQELMDDMEQFVNKDSTVMYIENIESRLNSPSISVQERSNLESQKHFLDYISKGGAKIADMSGVTTLSGIKQASGSQLHNIVYKVGKFFGHKFEPFGAVKIAAKMGKICKFGIPVVTAGLSIFLSVKEKKDEEKQIKMIKAAKEQYEADTRSTISKIRNKLEDEVQNSIIANYDNKLEEVNKMKTELGHTIMNNKEVQNRITELYGRYDSLLKRISAESEIDD